MRELFPGHYRPTEEGFRQLWQSCIFSFDANVLLNIFKFSPKTREYFSKILDQVQDRIWLPYQVAFEYHKHRENRILAQLELIDYEKSCGDFLKFKDSLANYRNHPLLDHTQLVEVADRAESELKKLFAHAVEMQSKYEEESEALKNRIADLFSDDKVGRQYTPDELAKKYLVGEERYKGIIPPGFKDAKKPEPDKYGDVIIWFQLLDFATEQKKDVIVITDDTKEDWWLKKKGRLFGPLPELRAEMRSQAGVDFYLYQSDQFVDYAGEMLSINTRSERTEMVKEVQEIRRIEAAESASGGYLISIASQLLAQLAQLHNIPEECSSPMVAAILAEMGVISVQRASILSDILLDNSRWSATAGSRHDRRNILLDTIEFLQQKLPKPGSAGGPVEN